jgi:hypothetical protein
MAGEPLLIESSGEWKTKALERHAALRLSYSKMIGWYDEVNNIVDPEWLERQAKSRSAKHHTIADVHPLYRLLNEGSDTALIQVCELGMYLEAFKADAAFSEIAKALASPKFSSTVFELAMAFRWKFAGGSIQLQPPASGGRIGDFCCTLNDVSFLIEASNIPAEMFETLSFRAPLLIQRTVSSYLSPGSVLVVKFQVNSAPSGMWEQALVDALKSSCYESVNLNPSEALPTFKVFDELRIDVERFASGDAAIYAAAQESWDVRFDQITETVPHELQLRVLVRLPSQDVRYTSRLLKKLVREAKQLSRVPGPRVVLLDVTGIEPNALELKTEELREELRKELINRSKLACVWLISRVWTTEMRYGYWGVFVPNPESPYQIPHSLIERFAHNECCWDFIGGTEIRHTTEEYACRSFLGRQPIFEGYIDRWP